MAATYDAPSVWARYLLTRRVLEAVTATLARECVDVMAVKGIVTSEWLYREPGERPLTDLDVRVRPRDLNTILRVSEGAGWRIERHLWSYRSVVLQVDGIHVDVETYVGPPGLSSLTVDHMLSNARQDSQGVWVPEMHDHAVLLTINVFKDKMALAMPWALEDVARMVDAPGFDHGRYVARVHEARVAGAAWFVADWMVRARKHETWRAIQELLESATPASAAYGRLVRRVLASTAPESLSVRLLTRAASDDAWRWPAALGLSLVAEAELRWLGRR